MKHKIYTQVFVPLVVLVLFSGCSTRLDKAEYFNYFNQFWEGSYIEFKSDDLTYQLQYRPAEFQALNDLKSQEGITLGDFKKSKSEYQDQQVFCLRIVGEGKGDVLKQNIADESEYYQRVEKLTSQFPLMIQGVTNSDTLYPAFHHFERTYQISPYVQVLFALKAGQEDEEIMKLEYYDEVFSDGNQIVFDQMNTYIKQLPKLNL